MEKYEPGKDSVSTNKDEQSKISQIPPKIQEYINRVKSGENINSFGEIPESWKEMIRNNTEKLNPLENSTNIVDQMPIPIYEETFADKELKIQQIRGEIDLLYGNENKRSPESLSDMTQEEFAQWLQLHKDDLEKIEKETKNLMGKTIITKPFGKTLGYYDLLVLRPELREEAINTINSEVIPMDFDDERKYYKTIMAEEDKYPNSDSNPEWFGLNFGDTKNTEKDGRRRKGYVTLDSRSIENFKENIPTVIDKLNTALLGKYNGSFKISQKVRSLNNRFDNIVVHGANEKEVDIALKIIVETLENLNISSSVAQKGKDGINKLGNKTSHTKLLEEKIQNNEL